MKLNILLLAIVLFHIVLSTEASPWKRPRGKHVRARQWQNRQQRKKLKRRVNLKKDRKFIGSGKLRNIEPSSREKIAVKDIKKNEHYIDPAVLDKIRQVEDMKDFIRIFKPKGFTLKKEVVPNKKSDKSQVFGSKSHTSVAVETSIYHEGRKFSNFAEDSGTSTACIPRATPQSLATLGKVTFPSCIFVKKCGGCCGAARHCVSDATKNKLVTVFELSGASFQSVTKTFVEHSTCKCDCIVKASDCTAKQTYSKNRCQCECNRTPEACPSQKIWNRGACDCICTNKRQCSSSLREWDEKTCSCACTKAKCPSGQTRNPENCRCYNIFGDAIGSFSQFEPYANGRREADDDSDDDYWPDY